MKCNSILDEIRQFVVFMTTQRQSAYQKKCASTKSLDHQHKQLVYDALQNSLNKQLAFRYGTWSLSELFEVTGKIFVSIYCILLHKFLALDGIFARLH